MVALGLDTHTSLRGSCTDYPPTKLQRNQWTAFPVPWPSAHIIAANSTRISYQFKGKWMFRRN